MILNRANDAWPFLVVLGVLVFIHELGHYLAARWRGVHVEAFSIGFGRALVSWQDRHGTTWKLAWIPLGGYVKLHGQEQPEDVTEEVRASWRAGETFHEKSVLSRAIVVAAGPAANFLLAACLFAGLFMFNGRAVTTPLVNDVVALSPAERAGLRSGDRIDSVDGVAIARFEDVVAAVSSRPGKTVAIQITRQGLTQMVEATLEARSVGSHMTGVLGVKGGEVTYERMNPLAAIPAGIAQTWDVGAQTLDGVWGMISGARGTDDLGGPVRIAQLSSQVAKLGIASLIGFIAVLSVNLGLINLFPVPVLDGGHLTFYAFEALRGRPLPPKAVEVCFRVGLALLLALFVFATWNDLSHLGLFRWVASILA